MLFVEVKRLKYTYIRTVTPKIHTLYTRDWSRVQSCMYMCSRITKAEWSCGCVKK